MDIDFNTLEIRHREKMNRFEIVINGKKAFISYQRQPTNLVLDHTWVPPQYEGHGIAARLTQSALEYAKAQNLKVVPACPYVEAYLKKHPEFQELLETSGS